MLLINTAEGGVNGATVVAGDGGSGSAWTDAVVDTNRLTYSSDNVLHGNLAYKFNQNAATLGVGWNSLVLGTLTEHYGRFYACVTGTPTASNKFVRGAFGSQAFGINLGSTARIFIKNSGDTTIWQSSTVVTFNTWFRIEWHLVHNGASGTLEVRIFTDPESVAYTETSGDITSNYANGMSAIRYGPSNPTPAMPLFYMDEMGLADAATGWLGPTTANTAQAWLFAA
ncbi:MAG: hypothetical protein WBP26_05045 [Candidatus Saccharimonadales bacterium]